MTDVHGDDRAQRNAELGALLELRSRQLDELHGWRMYNWLKSLDDEDRAAVERMMAERG